MPKNATETYSPHPAARHLNLRSEDYPKIETVRAALQEFQKQKRREASPLRLVPAARSGDMNRQSENHGASNTETSARSN